MPETEKTCEIFEIVQFSIEIYKSHSLNPTTKMSIYDAGGMYRNHVFFCNKRLRTKYINESA